MSFNSNKVKSNVITKVNVNEVVSGASTLIDHNLFMVDHDYLHILNERKSISMKKKGKVEWEFNRSCQSTWITKFLWVNMIDVLNGKMHMV